MQDTRGVASLRSLPPRVENCGEIRMILNKLRNGQMFTPRAKKYQTFNFSPESVT